ncbi:MAG: class II aldolase/adducin family protein [Patescibacteria group bacterium]
MRRVQRENAPALDRLCAEVCEANRMLADRNLIIQTEGNASGRWQNWMAIKPSGVPYNKLEPDMIVVVDITTGEWLDPTGFAPSSDAPTHLVLYKHFGEKIGGIVHTHSPSAVAFGQMGMSIPCYGTTHADEFFGEIPVTRTLTPSEIATEYEENTGRILAEKLDPLKMPAALVYGHGPFIVGPDARTTVARAEVLEKVASIAISMHTLGDPKPIPRELMEKHWMRKHGKEKYYGQK